MVWTPTLERLIFVRVCFQVTFLSISESKFRRLGLHVQGFHKEGIAKINFSQKSFFVDFGIEFYFFLETLGAVFLVFWFFESKKQQLLPGLAASGPQP